MDVALGCPGDISWYDVFDDDYVLAEFVVGRAFNPDHTWSIRYDLAAMTRIATIP